MKKIIVLIVIIEIIIFFLIVFFSEDLMEIPLFNFLIKHSRDFLHF